MPKSIEEVLKIYGQKTQTRYEPLFKSAGFSFPPPGLILAVFKEEAVLHVIARDAGRTALISTYPVTALSGKRGPKLREGDRQVPEGIYGVEYFNPNSRFHLSFKISYPNGRDKARAALAGIENPGTDIFIHGKSESTGCVAVGDEAIEELFTLTALTGAERTEVLIFPNFPGEAEEFLPCEICAADTEDLYRELMARYKKLPFGCRT